MAIKDFVNSLKKTVIKNTPVAGSLYTAGNLMNKGFKATQPKQQITGSNYAGYVPPTVQKANSISSNIGATGTQGTTIAPPKDKQVKYNLPPAGNQFVQNQMSSTTPVQQYETPSAQQFQSSQQPKSSSQKDAYIQAYKSYIDSLKESADVKEAKQAYLDFAKSRDTGLQKIQDQTIPMQFITGQQRSLANQAAIQEANLQGKIGLAQDAQKATIDSLKAGLDFQGKLLEQDKPIEVGGVLYQVQSDGSYVPITSKESEGFTLGKDQVRYDAQGNVIAGGGSQGVMGGYTPGADPIADSWIKYVQGGGKITDVPDKYQNAVAQGVTTQPKQQSEISKNVVSVIDELLANPSLGNISGLLGQTFLGGVTGQAALAKNKFNQLKGLLSLDNIKYLKGTGAISDAEQRLLANAASAVERNLSDADFRNELIKLKDGLAAVKDNKLAPDEEQYLRSKGYNDAQIKELQASFNSVGNTSASIPQSSRLAYVNNNPGNLRFAGQAGAVQGEGGFAKFPSPEAGIKALENQIKLDASRGLTLAQFINKYAPPSENDTSKYIKDVIKMTGASPLTPINNIDIKSLTRAIAQKESGTRIA